MSTSPSEQSRPDYDREGLVLAPDDLLQAGLGKALACLAVGFFLLVCVGGGVWDLLDPAPAPYALGVERTLEERRRASAKILDGSKMAVWSGDHQSVSNVRATLVPWYVAGLVHYLGEANEDILVGKEDWMFRWDRLNAGPGANDPRAPELGARVLRAVERRMASLGLKLLLMPLPRKAVIAAEYLPAGIDTYQEFDPAVLARLKQWGIPHIDLFDVFEGWSAKDLWYTQDTHWRHQAQLLAAEAVQKVWGLGPAKKDRAAVIVPTPKELPRRSMMLSLGLAPTHPANSVLLDEPGQRFALRRHHAREHGWKLPPPAEQPLWAVVGTSFTAGDQLVRLLANVLGSTPLDASDRGKKSIGSLGERLKRRAESRPPLWLLEVPLYQVFYDVRGGKHLEVGAEVFKFYGHSADSPVQVLFKRKPLKPIGSSLLNLPRGILVHDGDGALILRLRASRAPTRDLLIDLRQDDMRYSVAWPAGAEQFDLPLVAPGRSDGALHLGCKSPRMLGQLSYEVISEYDVAEGLDTIESAPAADKLPKSWTQERLFAEPQYLNRHSALWLDPEGLRNGMLHVELLPAESTAQGKPVALRKLGQVHLHSEGQLLLYAGGPGGPYRGVRLSGRGTVPEQSGVLRLVSLPKQD
ncbi:MAG: hypothetical protein ACI9HE_001610 [Planctomycetota bacterium]|jgi:hypothetical protein